jgi:hypothetical protein
VTAVVTAEAVDSTAEVTPLEKPNMAPPTIQWRTTARTPTMLVTECRKFRFMRSEMKPMSRTMSGDRAPPSRPAILRLSRSVLPVDDTPLVIPVSIWRSEGTKIRISPITITRKDKMLKVREAICKLTPESTIVSKRE